MWEKNRSKKKWKCSVRLCAMIIASSQLVLALLLLHVFDVPAIDGIAKMFFSLPPPPRNSSTSPPVVVVVREPPTWLQIDPSLHCEPRDCFKARCSLVESSSPLQRMCTTTNPNKTFQQVNMNVASSKTSSPRLRGRSKNSIEVDRLIAAGQDQTTMSGKIQKCHDSPPYDALPLPIPTSNRSNLTWGERLQNFKRQTAWLLPGGAWRDWYTEGTCGLPNHGGSAKMYFDNSTGLYTLENVCLRPRGTLMGYQPQILDDYDAHDDCGVVETLTHFTSARAALYRIENMSAAPHCVVDQAMVLLNFGAIRAENSGHWFHRLGSIVRMMEQLGELVPLAVMLNIHSLWRASYTQQHHMIEAITNHWLSVFEEDFKDNKHLPNIFKFANIDLDETTLHAPICFRKMYYYYDCRGSCPPADDTPFRRFSFRLHGLRTARDQETMRLVTQRYRTCFGVAQRTTPPIAAGEKVHALFAVRSRHRRLLFQPQIIAALRRAFASEMHLTPFEHVFYPFADIVRIYSGADMVLGMYGAAHSWSVFLPPWGVTVILSALRVPSSFNVPMELLFLEFTTEAFAANVSCVHFSPPAAEMRLVSWDNWLPGYELATKPQHFVELVRSGLCAVAAESRSAATALCALPSLSTADTSLSHPEQVAWLLAIHVIPGGSRRLEKFLLDPTTISNALSTLTTEAPHVVIVLEKCINDERTMEMAWLLSYFRTLRRVFMSSNPAASSRGPNCEGHNDEKYFAYFTYWPVEKFVPTTIAASGADVVLMSMLQLLRWTPLQDDAAFVVPRVMLIAATMDMLPVQVVVQHLLVHVLGTMSTQFEVVTSPSLGFIAVFAKKK